MKYFRFCMNAVLPMSLCLSLCVGCSGEKGGDNVPKAAENAEVTTTAPETVSAENSAQNLTATGSVRKPAELDTAVNAHIQKVLKENPELEKAEAPIQMTYFFIRALQMDNTPAVMGMLTQDAYREMSARQGEKFPCPEFLKNSDVALGNVQYLTDDMSEGENVENVENVGANETAENAGNAVPEGNIVGARVGTIWKIKTETGIIEENIAWVFRFEDDAWLVAGMISVVDPNYPPILFNFENLAETEAEFAARAEEVEKINAEAARNAENAESTDRKTNKNAENAEGTDRKTGKSAENAEKTVKDNTGNSDNNAGNTDNNVENTIDNVKEDDENGEKDETSTESAGVALELPESLP